MSKEVFIKALIHSKKKKRIEEVPQGIKVSTWLKAVQEAAFVLGQIETDAVSSPKAKSRSILRAKLLALEIKALPKNANIDSLLADSPKGERNRKPRADQVSIQCPSYGLGNCTKTFCVSKSWWGLRPKNSDGTSNVLSIHWANFFMGLHNKGKINHSAMKMADNHLRNMFTHHLAKHDGTIFPYFDFYQKKRVSDVILQNSNIKKARVARDLEDINAETKMLRDSSNKNVPDMSVRQV